ncbi:hypothetical protein KP77_28320 [Jeotgalibacillus alimentarius]|uniref:Uncharacterized protein n=2 Tax=Jeotgalibacillus alimentarius TaxID=135826 RepID=A0A0C2R8U1_9BACL|nr:hypothetical protein KP77_28320 [Jeotgalibacillus alimentarius]
MKSDETFWSSESFQDIVETHYMTDSGKIRSYGTNENEQFLLESTGLYVQWLADQELLEDVEIQLDVIEREFFVEENDKQFLAWKIEGQERAQTTAWIDDARVLPYMTNKDRLIQSINKNQVKDGMVADFYDWAQQQSSNRVVLSYGMEEFDGLNLEGMQQLYEKIAQAEGTFYDEFYLIEEEQFEKADEVHMVDQLLIALELEELNLSNDQFWNWLQNEWETEGSISGRYDRNSLKGNLVESGAVYGIAAELAMQKSESELAEKWKQRGFELVYRENGDYGDVHFFDLVWNAP